jgi:hypothetical protein
MELGPGGARDGGVQPWWGMEAARGASAMGEGGGGDREGADGDREGAG